MVINLSHVLEFRGWSACISPGLGISSLPWTDYGTDSPFIAQDNVQIQIHTHHKVSRGD